MTHDTDPEVTWKPPCPRCGAPSWCTSAERSHVVAWVSFLVFMKCGNEHSWSASWTERAK